MTTNYEESARVRAASGSDPGPAATATGSSSPGSRGGSGAPGAHAEAASFEALARRVKPAVDAALEKSLDLALEEARAHGPSVTATVDAMRALALRGGKRLRAVLVAAAFEGCGGEGGADAVVLAGVSFELLQTYLLVHDDWMDGDATRRGGPSVHAALAAHFASDTLGASGAVLAGDYASALAQDALLAVPRPAACVLAAARELARVQRDVTLGQMIDLMADASPGADVDTAYALKTASYTVRGPLVVGAALAGAPAATREALERYARPLGIAFQLRDDLLGTFGDAEATGKPVGADLRRGKRTALVVEMEKEPYGQRLLDRVLGVADAPDDEVLALSRRMVESGAKGRVEARVTALLDEARRALGAPAVPATLRQMLGSAADALGHRER